MRVSARVGKHWSPEYSRAAIFRVCTVIEKEKEKAKEEERAR